MVKRDNSKILWDFIKEFEEERQNEEWREIKDYNGMYQISNLGKVKSIWDKEFPKILSVRSQRGWPRTNLYKYIEGNRYVCKRAVAMLVAEHFISNPHNFTNIDFIDGDYRNVKVKNIIWVSDAYKPPYELEHLYRLLPPYNRND